MENKIKKCSSIEHKEIDAIFYCRNCKVYMCNKCESFHSKLLQNHYEYNLNKDDINNIFTGFCEEENHLEKLEYFCKTHNKLCCASCIVKFKKKGKGQHTDCNICIIEDIKDEKKNKLKENIKYLEDLSHSFKHSINKLKIIYEKINKNKEEIKLSIQKIFTTIRNAINEREDELLLEVDNKFNNIYFNEDIIKKGENIPNKIKASLEKGKEIDKEWNDDNMLNSYINNCINIENNIMDINEINEILNKTNNNSINLEIKYNLDEKEINKFLKNFGNIYENNLLDSKIIDNGEYNKLKNWIDPNKNIKAELLYRMSINGEKISKFHELCDNKGATLTLFHVKEGNNKVGIYTPLSWDSFSSWKNDKETFIFSLNKNKKYKKKTESSSIYCNKNGGPYTSYFGCWLTNTMRSIAYWRNEIKNYYDNNDDILPSNDNTKFFELYEVEAFKMLIDK